MEMTQLNTRIPVSLKQQGDEVLARAGMTVSDIVRALWTFMAEQQQVPDFALATQEDDVVRQKLELIDACSQSAQDLARTIGIDLHTEEPFDFDALEDDVLEMLIDEHEALNA